MRLFHALLFDRYVEGPILTAVSYAWSGLVPRAEKLKFTFVVDTVSGGGTPTLTATLHDGPMSDGQLALKTLLDVQPPTSGVNTYPAFYTPSDPYPVSGYTLLRLELTGGSPPPKAHVRVWVCGRGERLLNRPPIPTSFAAQVQAARMLDEEDKVPAQKRLTRAGSSVFVPPEMFLPEAKWEQ